MRIAIFVAVLLIALGYAFLRGGGPERVMAGIATTMVASDQILHQFIATEFHTLDLGHLAIDLFGALTTTALALTAHRFWPMVAAVAHIVPLLAHLSRVLDLSVHPVAYLSMQVASSWLVPPLLVLATWRHQRRLRQNGSDPSWNASLRRSNRPKANG